MRYSNIPNSLFIANRQRLSQLLQPKSLVLLTSNDIMPTNADGTMGFRQNTDLFHLSGIDQEESVLLLFPDNPDVKHREILFLRETSEHIAIWEGHKYTKAEAETTSGISKIYWTHQFESVLRGLAFEAENIYLNANEHYRADIQVQTREVRFLENIKAQFPLHQYQRLAPLMHRIRSVKMPEEITLMKEAIRITNDGFMRILGFVKPGVMEYEIEAEFIHEFTRQRSDGFAYTPIIAAGSNSNVLHYIENSRVCNNGDLLLLDVAASYANYAADLTRTIPVNGRYSPRQKEVYNAVLRVMKAAREMLVVGNSWGEYHTEVGKIMENELIGLKLLDKQAVATQNPEMPLYKKYFMHGTSHFLGLDVHDVGSRYRPFEAGMVFTCEPGIYIPEEGFGIRIENNILITEQGNIDLMNDIPLEANEIEELMNR